MLCVNNEKLLGELRDRYSLADLARIKSFLSVHDVTTFPQIGETGLFPAAGSSTYIGHTKYDRIWVRDNIHIANAHRLLGKVSIACEAMGSLFAMFKTQKDRFNFYINGEVDRKDLSRRPHVRFLTTDGQDFDFESWNAQNDALGYFLWLACTLILERSYSPRADDIAMLRTFVSFFESIEFWHDEDSGHWEEEPKIQASSIGTVLAGLKQYLLLLDHLSLDWCSDEKQRVLHLCDTAQSNLKAILPAESIQTDKRRDFDASLLFLIFPLGLLSGEIARLIVERVENNLKGDYGIKRYLGDLFWAPDYDEIVPPDRWTEDTTQDTETRKQLVTITIGVDEAQWCIFDSVLSVFYGLEYRFASSERQTLLQKQIHYFNRALGQITGPEAGEFSYRCPELYYRKKGRYVHNKTTPLLWAQANLLLAVKVLEENVRASQGDIS